MKKRIIKLSNIFVMTENYVSNIGLTSGKMGIIMFLYYSSRIVNCKSYQDLADSLMDKLFEDIKSNTNFSFSNGLAGLPFAINRLVKDKFIDADPDDIFIQLDKKIHSGYERRNINDFAEDFPLFSYGLYLLERNIYNNNESEMEEAGRQGVDVALTICEEVYNSNFVFNNRTLAYTNSVLYFLIRLNGNQHYYKRSNLIIELIMSKIVMY
ncbi:lanthionine synthetase-like protein [Arcticibacter tournemirensis]|uniref:lanthionine synthetase LanC family protein n=1 Tax=Arcticibacter tournemirensis TaxID=699437 RepID=UPI001151F49A|nr:lanthionine synthetase LanC family protein [Arcticibacter tournemirensis]TQM51503.1 lanthionine synthetase-like protein [Arcticibacter tournemirensis]